MNLDLRLPLGLMFSLFGAALTAYGLVDSMASVSVRGWSAGA